MYGSTSPGVLSPCVTKIPNRFSVKKFVALSGSTSARSQPGTQLSGHHPLARVLGGLQRWSAPGGEPSAGGAVVTLDVYAEDAPQEVGVYVEYVNDESARVLNHFYSVFPRAFEFVN